MSRRHPLTRSPTPRRATPSVSNNRREQQQQLPSLPPTPTSSRRLPLPPSSLRSPPPTSTAGHHRLISDESVRIGKQYQQMSKEITNLLNDKSDEYIHQLLDVLEDTRKKWSECEKDNVRLATLYKTLQKDLEEAAEKNENLTDLLNNARAQISHLSMAKKKVEEELNRCKRRLKNSNTENSSSPKSTTQSEDVSSGIVSMETPKKRNNNLLRRSNSVPHHLRHLSSASSYSYGNTSLIMKEKASSAAASPAAVPLCRQAKMTPAISFENLNKIDFRQHSFEIRRLFIKNICHVCSLAIKFGAESLKCSVCKVICHQNCRLRAPSPCVPFFMPPKASNGRLRLGEYCSDEIVPKLPHLIIRCVQYLNTQIFQKGLYVDLSHDAEAELLLKLILYDRNPSNVVKFGPKVAAQCILKFLSSLRESLIFETSIPEFSKAAKFPDDSLLENEIYELPIVHKNTLAYLFLHWKLLIQESNSNGLCEELLGRAILPAIMRVTIYEVSTFLPVFYRLLSLSKSFWYSAIDTTLSRASSKKSKGGTPYALTVAKIHEQQEARFSRHLGN